MGVSAEGVSWNEAGQKRRAMRGYSPGDQSVGRPRRKRACEELKEIGSGWALGRGALEET